MASTSSLFAQVVASVMKRNPKFGVVQDRRFRAHFGVTPNVCSIAWQIVQSQHKLTIIPEHFLWALMFLKIYLSVHFHATIAGVDEKNFRSKV